MIWYFIAGALFVLAMGLMFFNYMRDRRYLKKKTSEAFGPVLKAEIDREREEGIARREKFEEALKEAEEASAREDEHHGPYA